MIRRRGGEFAATQLAEVSLSALSSTLNMPIQPIMCNVCARCMLPGVGGEGREGEIEGGRRLLVNTDAVRVGGKGGLAVHAHQPPA